MKLVIPMPSEPDSSLDPIPLDLGDCAFVPVTPVQDFKVKDDGLIVPPVAPIASAAVEAESEDSGCLTWTLIVLGIMSGIGALMGSPVAQICFVIILVGLALMPRSKRSIYNSGPKPEPTTSLKETFVGLGITSAICVVLWLIYYTFYAGW